tara:strand:- start:431 stop:610 length:180 start_codon:yes stop_codon:yes gene_type:complete
MEFLEFQGKKWVVVNKVKAHLVNDPNNLKSSYGCDLVLKNNQNIFYMLDEVIDAEFEEL